MEEPIKEKEEDNICTHENAVPYDMWNIREMYCPDCGVMVYDFSI